MVDFCCRKWDMVCIKLFIVVEKEVLNFISLGNYYFCFVFGVIGNLEAADPKFLPLGLS